MRRTITFLLMPATIVLAACGGDAAPSGPGVGANSATAATATGTDSVAAAATSAFVPANGETAACADTRLSITFDAPPTLGTSGRIKVMRASDGSVADTIDISGAPVTAGGETQTYMPAANTEIDKLGNNVGSLTQWRYVYYTPVTISGNTATVRLHDGVLAYGTRYYVSVDNGVLNGRIGGKAFAGIASPTAWAFQTHAAPRSPTAVTVAASGTSDFRSVQGALDWIMQNGCVTCTNANDAKTITIANGSYNEQLFLRNVNNLTIAGQSRTGVVVYDDNYESYNPSTGGSRTAPQSTLTTEGSGTRRSLGGGRSVFLVEGADLLKLTNFTLQNSHVKRAVDNNQAEAIYYNSATLNGSRLSATQMTFLSAQDTLQLKGWAWFYQSLIAGDVDFIWGSPYAALFEQSELHTVADPVTPTSGGYVFQSRAAYGFPGFVVLDGTLTADAAVPAGATYLARSGGLASPAYCTTAYTGSGSFGNANLGCDDVAYIGTRMGTHVAADGWYTNPTPNPASPTAAAGWRETGSLDASGHALSTSGRNSVVATTGADLSGLNTRAKVFASWNNNAGWTPAP
ncbi:pectate lyase [Burkholderia glumae]|uniref:Pectate lyase n=1 Tax=Burkholderia glumae TaxID=337 RepID=A0AAP9XVP2_BURGL|nr:pectate lyase [Burkholderia glumae]ACR32218.1 Bifunctional pectinolytic enzyme pectin methylesterase/pectate lyase [Burkholderia glumae BGR1]AJY64569.1 pectinesterase family protein [Burkholderia glumae LMG 2196 = ATCC 33617]KHJ60550.1 pectate lyase [Burkholderia glumae]MCM2484594.1 pectate lyase [Burkholderia glumae]MCM2510287.1 pectate lyase [Burkholderia glumae]